MEEEKAVRIKDFIDLAKEGKKVEVEIELRTQNIQQKIHPGDTEDKKGEVDAYLLIGDYSFKVEGKEQGEDSKVSKIYVWGFAEESIGTRRIHRNIANDRLEMDYQRLRAAGVEFEPKYFSKCLL
ncbi:MAG: hypothetical protein WC560_10375 [Syntrophales bacterium]